MIFLESLRIAWLGITGNKLRSFLTMLGVIFGVAAVIALVSLGEGTRARVTAQIQQLGTNLVTISATRPAFRVEPTDITVLRREIPEIEAALPMVSQGSATVKSDTYQYDTRIEGTGPDYLAVRDRSLLQGAFFTEEDVSGRRRVAVLGTTASRQLFGETASPVGRPVRLLGQTFTVIGVLDSKGYGAGGQDLDDVVIVPYSSLQRLLGMNRLQQVIFKVRHADASPQVVAQIQQFYLQKHRTADSVRVFSQDQLLDTVGETTRFITLFLGFVASISLLVGGIGIMNIMLVSVSERTREIGIRKALGAKKLFILLQFLIEALVLSLSGGALGIGLGWGISALAGRLSQFQTRVSPVSVAVSFGFAAAVGIFFGLYPAIRAANLDPIEALRRE